MKEIMTDQQVETRRGLEQFEKTILNGVGKTIAGVGGGRVLRTTAAFSLVLTACSTAVTPRTPEATQGIEPVATEVVSIPTVLPRTEGASSGKYGIEGGPAHGVEDPNTYNLRELITEEDWEKIKNEVHIEDLDNGNRLIIYPLPWGCEVQEDGTNSQKFISLTRELHPDVHDVEVAAMCDIDPDSSTYGSVPKTNYKKFSLDQLVEGISSTKLKPDSLIIDASDGGIWRMGPEDAEIVGPIPGVFQGWVEKESAPGADTNEDVRYGRWANREGMGIVRFEKVSLEELSEEK
jgi:hypothetical protein